MPLREELVPYRVAQPVDHGVGRGPGARRLGVGWLMESVELLSFTSDPTRPLALPTDTPHQTPPTPPLAPPQLYSRRVRGRHQLHHALVRQEPPLPADLHAALGGHLRLQADEYVGAAGDDLLDLGLALLVRGAAVGRLWGWLGWFGGQLGLGDWGGVCCLLGGGRWIGPRPRQ